MQALFKLVDDHGSADTDHTIQKKGLIVDGAPIAGKRVAHVDGRTVCRVEVTV